LGSGSWCMLTKGRDMAQIASHLSSLPICQNGSCLVYRLAGNWRDREGVGQGLLRNPRGRIRQSTAGLSKPDPGTLLIFYKVTKYFCHPLPTCLTLFFFEKLPTTLVGMAIWGDGLIKVA